MHNDIGSNNSSFMVKTKGKKTNNFSIMRIALRNQVSNNLIQEIK